MDKKLFKSRKKLIVIIILLILCIGAVIFTANDYFLYDRTIAKVIEVSETLDSSSPALIGSTEDNYAQRLTAVIKNGDHKGEKITVINKYSSSLVTDEKYSEGDCLFIDLKTRSDGTLKAVCTGFKRDVYTVGVVALFIFAIVLVGGRKGALSVMSVIFNMVIFYIAIELYFKGIDLFLLCCAAAVIFSAGSLSMVSGLNKKTAAAVISALCGTTVTIIIAYIVLKITGGSGVRFDQMQYLIRPYEVIFISELLIGGLGAIMDISITMSSSMSELIDKDSSISFDSLKKSGVEIGKDIMGTMTNVLFFTYVCGCIPLIVLAMRNDTRFSDIMKNYLNLEIVRSFVGSIGIVITIPIAIFISSRLLKGKRNDKQEEKRGDE